MRRWTTTLAEVRNFFQRIGGVVERYRSGPRNSELEQSAVRLLIGLVLFYYYFVHVGGAISASSSRIHLDARWVMGIFLLASASLVVCIHIKPGVVPLRRAISILIDTVTLTALLIIGGVHSAPLFFLYLWIIIGNGFRFGQMYLFIALAATLVGFGMVIFIVPYWHTEKYLSIGLWLGTLLISMYFSLLVGRLFKALDQANIANMAKRQFICAVSHELRTPLNAIIGMVDLLRGTKVDAEQREMLDCMTTTSQLMLSQIEDVLDFSKIEAGKMVVERTEFAIYELVESILSMFRYRVEPGAVELIRQIDCTIPAMLTGDPHHLRQILVNLVGNAVKFTEQGRIVLKIQRVASSEDSVRLLFKIKDTGIGIPENVQGRIFESFTQADTSTARKYGGTGLGTTICKQLIELMGGKIGFHSEPGKGSEFWFELVFNAKAVVEDICLLGCAPSIIIGCGKAGRTLAENLASISRVQPLLAMNVQEAESRLGQGRLAGRSVNMAFLLADMNSGQSCFDLASRLKADAERLKETADNSAFIIILMVPEEFPQALLNDIVDQAGIYSVLPSNYDSRMLTNILCAQTSAMAAGSPLRINASALNHEPASFSPSFPAIADVDSLHILIVEDNPTNRKVLQKILERAGYRCTLAQDGEEALDMMVGQVFDAIVLDLNMPKVPGTEVACFCKVIGGPHAVTPIIMFSASVTQEAREESFEAGADAFMAKPIDVANFLEVLDRLIRESRTPKDTAENLAILPLTLPGSGLEPVLELEKLSNLETVSTDPAFLDELIVEFMQEGRRLIDVISQGFETSDWSRIGPALHALRGSALSVGASSLKMICARIEKLPQSELQVRRTEIQGDLNSCFSLLCEELEAYRNRRMKGRGNAALR